MGKYTQNALDYVDFLPRLLFDINTEGGIEFIIPWWGNFIILAIVIYFLGAKLFKGYWDDIILIDGTLLERGVFLTIILSFIAFFYLMGEVNSIRKNIEENLETHPNQKMIFKQG